MRTSGFKQSEPGGLYLPVRAAIAGHVRWQVLDERGVPDVPRSESGHPIGPIEGVKQSNLITDAGMDALANRASLFVVTTGNVGSVGVRSTRRRLHVGTGSATPSVTDTALGNEVQNAASSGSFSTGNVNYAFDATNNVFRAVSLATRVVTMTADRSITEFGFDHDTGDSIFIRELLRDAGGTPISVSLLAGKSLRVDHTHTIELPAPAAGTAATIGVDQYDAGNNLIGSASQDVIYGPATNAAASLASLQSIFNIWNPTNDSSQSVWVITTSKVFDRQLLAVGNGTNIGAFGGTPAYVPGSFQRPKRYVVSAGSGNLGWRGFWIGGTGIDDSRFGGPLVIFDDPATYTKQSTDTLQIGVLSTWARA